MTDFRHVTFISAGAGSGKTYRLTQELKKALLEDGVDPAKVVATTFTVKAASELNERVRSSLIQAGRVDVADQSFLAGQTGKSLTAHPSNQGQTNLPCDIDAPSVHFEFHGTD